jgi:hypothetical protein
MSFVAKTNTRCKSFYLDVCHKFCFFPNYLMLYKLFKNVTNLYEFYWKNRRQTLQIFSVSCVSLDFSMMSTCYYNVIKFECFGCNNCVFC